MMAGKKLSREELVEQVKRLEEKLRELGLSSGEPPTKEEGLAENVLAALGKMVPGLQKLTEVASQMPEFHKRLASIDEEIKRKFKEQPLRHASSEIARGIGRRALGIPPGVRRGRTRRGTSVSVGRARSSGQTSKRGGYRKPRPPKVHISPETPAQLPVDVFDENNHIVVLAEAPGLKRKDITVSLEPAAVVLTVDAPQHKSTQRVELPCEVSGPPKLLLRKGILKIQLAKVDQS